MCRFQWFMVECLIHFYRRATHWLASSREAVWPHLVGSTLHLGHCLAATARSPWSFGPEQYRQTAWAIFLLYLMSSFIGCQTINYYLTLGLRVCGGNLLGIIVHIYIYLILCVKEPNFGIVSVIAENQHRELQPLLRASAAEAAYSKFQRVPVGSRGSLPSPILPLQRGLYSTSIR